ncbi:MAG: magnesium transporter MgtE [Chloroflexi bacterium HGW-Chloroflexi-1]|nr:MAG: magnesium transporter MgtE [Chloroflexi bacterium HGW-Chloroflexi-1]
MAYLSNLIGRVVADVNGERIGRLDDLVASLRGDLLHPQIVALVVKHSGGPLLIPLDAVAVLIAPAIPLNRRSQDIAPYQVSQHDLYLARDVLDKQIIDTNGVRVVRVNDLELARVNGHFYVANVDIGGLGLLRRLGPARMAEKVARRLGRKLTPGIISWEDVELLPGDQPIRLKVASDKITDLHPADLAEIISDLSRAESGKLLESLDVKTVADALEEVEPEFQASLIDAMSDEMAADVLEEMAPDEVADLLAELSQDRSQELLNLMEDDEAADVRKLLAFPEDSAGGIMTTEFVAIRPDLNAEQALAVLRETAHEAETIFYVYVTDAEGCLLGVFSLQDLVLARPQTPVREFMHARVFTANLRDSQESVAQAISKYNLLAVPVVDDEGRLHGIVTADDALDKIIPTAWKKRLPRMYR